MRKKTGLIFALLILLSLVLIACGNGAVAPAPEEATEETTVEATEETTEEVVESMYNEAPMLAELVAAGELPPVDERLPVEPLVIDVVDSIGQYGGTLRRLYIPPGDTCGDSRINRTGLLRWSVDGNKVVPAIAKGWESSEDGKEWTIYLREGAKWSDGEDFTTDDVVWMYENVIMNEELASSPPFLMAGGTPGVVEAVDLYTFKITYSIPNFLFPEIMAQADQTCGGGVNIPYIPSHYMEQFHKDFNPDIDKLVEEAGFENWVQLFNHYHSFHNVPGRPSMRAWNAENAWGDDVVTLTRNPYYIAVDPEGNQLPYLDNLTYTGVADAETLNLKAVQGEVDFQGRHILSENIPLFIENGQRLTLWPVLGGAEAAIFPNYTFDGPEVEYINNVEFRRALSLAIDRESINEISMQGMGEARQAVPNKNHPHYPGDEYAYMWTEYDTDKANEMLDAILPNKDAEGFRLMENGERLVLNLASAPAFGAWPDIALQVADYWSAVGVKTESEEMTRALLFDSRRANEIPFFIWGEDTTGFTFSNLEKRIPVEQVNSFISSDWALYHQTDGAEGTQAPQYWLDFVDMHLLGPSLPDAERNALGVEIYKLIAENVHSIGIVGLSPMVQGILVTNEYLQNVPELGGNDWPLRTPSNGYPEQFWYANP